MATQCKRVKNNHENYENVSDLVKDDQRDDSQLIIISEIVKKYTTHAIAENYVYASIKNKVKRCNLCL